MFGKGAAMINLRIDDVELYPMISALWSEAEYNLRNGDDELAIDVLLLLRKIYATVGDDDGVQSVYAWAKINLDIDMLIREEL